MTVPPGLGGNRVPWGGAGHGGGGVEIVVGERPVKKLYHCFGPPHCVDSKIHCSLFLKFGAEAGGSRGYPWAIPWGLPKGRLDDSCAHCPSVPRPPRVAAPCFSRHNSKWSKPLMHLFCLWFPLCSAAPQRSEANTTVPTIRTNNLCASNRPPSSGLFGKFRFSPEEFILMWGGGGWAGAGRGPNSPPPPPRLLEAPVRKMILQMHTPARTSQCWSRQTPARTRSVHLDAPGQRHGQRPVSRTADPRSSQTGQVIRGLC